MNLNLLDMNAESQISDLKTGKFDRDLDPVSAKSSQRRHTIKLQAKKFTSKFETGKQATNHWMANSPERMANLYLKASGNLNELLARPWTAEERNES
jgi:hypothetical protein